MFLLQFVVGVCEWQRGAYPRTDSETGRQNSSGRGRGRVRGRSRKRECVKHSLGQHCAARWRPTGSRIRGLDAARPSLAAAKHRLERARVLLEHGQQARAHGDLGLAARLAHQLVVELRERARGWDASGAGGRGSGRRCKGSEARIVRASQRRGAAVAEASVTFSSWARRRAVRNSPWAWCRCTR